MTREVMRLRLEYNKNRPFERLGSYMLSVLGIYLGKIGFKKISKKMWEISWFPKGTVGRG